ncbi:MAG: DUF6623 family protein [Fibrobacteria bacterium]
MKLSSSHSAAKTMTPKATVCVHGNIVNPEYPENIDEVSRKGWGTTFWGKEDTVNWFHIPLSVPNFLDGGRPKLTRIFLFFHNTSRSIINALHIYDGPKLVKAFDSLRLAGDHARALHRANTFTIETPSEINFGLGLSVSVQFSASTDSSEPKPPRWILFTTAGAEFKI